jgi:broad specificity phosphatase PhoE
MTKVTLLRHGQTDYNAKGLLQGRIDNQLNATGLLQAQRAAEAIGPVDQIISSPLKRAIQTAKAFNVDTQIDENWIELNYGEWDGMPLQAIKKETWNKWKTDSSFKPPKGESLEELGKRVRLSLNNIEKNTDQHLLIVTHVSPIKAALAWALDVNDSIAWKTRLETASFTQINIDSDTPVLTKFNHTAENRD